MKWNWKYARPDWLFFDSLLIIGAIAVGFGVWFIPSWSNSDGFKKLTTAVHERVALQKKIKAEEARRKKQIEDEGIVYFGPGGTPQPVQPFKGKSPESPAPAPEK